MMNHLIRIFFICTMSSSLAWSAGGPSLDQRIGNTLPGDLAFHDETGVNVRFRELLTKPTVFVPVYLTCPQMCPLILNAVAQALGNIKWTVPGRDFQVITVSFNDRDTPNDARTKKKNFLAAIGKPYPESAWKFLTGDQQNIQRFLDAAGYQVAKNGMDFEHPAAIFVTSDKGRIIRYLHGVNYGSFDLEMAVGEAARGRLGLVTSRIIGYCFTYDPTRRAYVFNILQAVGLVMGALLVGFIGYLRFGASKKGAAAWKK